MRFHFSFHKNLTKYTSLSLNRVMNNLSLRKTGYKHFNSLKSDFIKEAPRLKMASLNNHFFSPNELEEISGEPNTCSLFIRDPRDLLVSGYFYHRNGVEPWTRISNPTKKDYEVVNGNIPRDIRLSGLSMSDYLKNCDLEKGLLVELEFRKNHFESINSWLRCEDPSILFIDYSELMESEERAFARLGNHHSLNQLQLKALSYFVNKYKASNNTKNKHIRNPNPGQWKKTLTDESLDLLNLKFPDLIARYEKISTKN